jgi:hypothetical protein
MTNDDDAFDINFDLPCLGCKYNLRGLRHGSKCPECGRLCDLRNYVVSDGGPRVRWDRLSVFDRVCAALAFPIGVLFILLGLVGLFTGASANFTLPPVLGFIPALVGWGIVKPAIVAWRFKKQSNEVPSSVLSAPSMYRDPIPRTVQDLDAEIERRVP